MCWAVSIAFDAGTNHGEQFFEVRGIFCSRLNIENVHVLAIPLIVIHTRENIASAVHKFFKGIMGKDWSDKVLGISTDGATSMIRKIS